MERGGGSVDSFQVLIDSDAFVAWSLPEDFFHQQVQALFEKLSKEKTRLVSTSLVIAETATVLSNRGGQATARLFLERIEQIGLPVIHITEEIQQEAMEFFKRQDTRGTSMVDCSNVVVTHRFFIPEIFSFDGFYKRLNLKIVG